LVVDHGIGSGLHGGRGEAAVGGRVGPVLRRIVVPKESVISDISFKVPGQGNTSGQPMQTRN
jgi:hypothetical protein